MGIQPSHSLILTIEHKDLKKSMNKVSRCYRLSVWVFPKFIYRTLILNVMAFGGGTFGRLLSHKGGAFMSEISALTKVQRNEPSEGVSCSFHSVRT